MAEYSRFRVERDVAMRMRDGITLRADVYRPDARGKFPALLMRTPYNRTPSASVVEGDPLRLVQSGYVVVEQDIRGRFASEGTFWPFRDDGSDGYDSVEWTAAQPWCTGKVGMFGSSYVGATQWLAAAERPPHLTAIYPQITATDYHEGWIYQGGAFALGFSLSWALTLAGETLTRGEPSSAGSDAANAYCAAFDAFLMSCFHLPLSGFSGLRGERLAPYYYEWLEHPADDRYSQRWSIERRHGAVATPALHLGGGTTSFLEGRFATTPG